MGNILTPENLLRQTLHYNYDYYRDLGQGAFKNDEYIVKRHVSECYISKPQDRTVIDQC